MVEATAVEARGRITPRDHGIWKADHIGMLARIASFIKSQGSVPAIQLAHAGRKASCHVPWEGGTVMRPTEGGWQCVAPSAIPFNAGNPLPSSLTTNEIGELTQSFVAAARRALAAGFEVLEIHSAHGYLLHEFLSPLSNQRNDDYGGSFENRVRFLLEVAEAVRAVWPERLPLWTRISSTDWAEGGWTPDDSVRLAELLRDKGVDLVDCSSGGLVPYARIPTTPGYQVPFAERIKREAKVLTGAVGLITEPKQADAIIRESKADIVLLARAVLRDPYWPLHAAQALGSPVVPPIQYERAFPKAK